MIVAVTTRQQPSSRDVRLHDPGVTESGSNGTGRTREGGRIPNLTPTRGVWRTRGAGSLAITSSFDPISDASLISSHMRRMAGFLRVSIGAVVFASLCPLFIKALRADRR